MVRGNELCGWVGGGNWLRGVWGKKWVRKEGECKLLRAAETGGVGGCGELVGAKPPKTNRRQDKDRNCHLEVICCTCYDQGHVERTCLNQEEPSIETAGGQMG